MTSIFGLLLALEYYAATPKAHCREEGGSSNFHFFNFQDDLAYALSTHDCLKNPNFID